MSVLVAVAPAGETVGTISSEVTSEGVGHLRGMAVLPEWRGAGIAAELLAAAEAELRDRRCTTVSLETTESGRVRAFFGMPLFEYVKRLAD